MISSLLFESLSLKLQPKYLATPAPYTNTLDKAQRIAAQVSDTWAKNSIELQLKISKNYLSKFKDDMPCVFMIRINKSKQFLSYINTSRFALVQICITVTIVKGMCFSSYYWTKQVGNKYKTYHNTSSWNSFNQNAFWNNVLIQTLSRTYKLEEQKGSNYHLP